MSKPAVSILIPVFNGEPFLAECLDSVLAQDFSDFEIVALDDGSTDGSAKLLEHYAQRDARLRWRRNTRNLGLGGNWNACLREARADLIKYVLQDDVLLDASVLRRMVAMMNQDPTVSLLVTASHRIDERSQKLRKRDCFGKSGSWEGKEVIVRCMEQNANLIGEPSLAIFRAAQAKRGFDEAFKQLTDLEMWYHLLEQGRFAYIAEPLCAFREHPNQQTEVNRRTGVSDGEGLMLAEKYFRRPWVKQFIKPRSLFVQIYCLKKNSGREAEGLVAALTEQLGPFGYRYQWLSYKLRRPFQNIWLSTTKRIEPLISKYSVQNSLVAL
jgi:glycosyltransferase involved in cell wall biosynthesis